MELPPHSSLACPDTNASCFTIPPVQKLRKSFQFVRYQVKAIFAHFQKGWPPPILFQAVNCSMAATASRISAREREASLKGKDGLAIGFVAHRFLQCLGGRQVYTDAKRTSPRPWCCRAYCWGTICWNVWSSHQCTLWRQRNCSGSSGSSRLATG